MKLKIADLEKRLGKKIKRNYKSLGIDLATITGVCLIKTDDKNISFDYSVIKFSSQVKLRYKQMVDLFKVIIQDNCIVILEDTFVGLNKKGAIILSRLGGIPLCLSILKEDENVKWEIISAVSARGKFSIKTAKYGKGKSKLAVMDWLKENLGLEIKEDNKADATILGMCGIIEDLDFRSNTQILKAKKKLKKAKNNGNKNI